MNPYGVLEPMEFDIEGNSYHALFGRNEIQAVMDSFAQWLDNNGEKSKILRNGGLIMLGALGIAVNLDRVHYS